MNNTIKNRRSALVVIITIVFSLIYTLSVFSSEISNTRKEKIISIISRFQEAGENLSDPDVRSAILKEVARSYTLEPEAKANILSREEISKMVREKVNLKFPDSHETLEKKAKEAATAKFKKAKINDYVRVTYEKGKKNYTVEGYFFGYGAMQHSVDIGGNLIALFDLIPEDRAKFDDKYREILTDQFIKNQIRDYYMRKNDYAVQVLDQIKEENVKYNESAGYILYNGQWMSPKDLCVALMDSMASRGMVAKAEPVPLENSPAKIIDEQPKEPDKIQPQPVESDKTKRAAEIRKKAEIEQQRIKTRYAGINADQGYGNAIWGMKHEDVNLIFDTLFDKNPQGDLEVLTFERGPIKKVELHFFHGYFYKVVVDFRVVDDLEIMERLYRKIVEAYGKTDQEKELELSQANAESEEKKEGEQNPETQETTPEEIPEETTLTWTGSETVGKLYVKLTPDKKSYSVFTLTKESPKLVEEVKVIIEKEKREKLEEEKKKLQKEYETFKIK